MQDFTVRCTHLDCYDAAPDTTRRSTSLQRHCTSGSTNLLRAGMILVRAPQPMRAASRTAASAAYVQMHTKTMLTIGGLCAVPSDGGSFCMPACVASVPRAPRPNTRSCEQRANGASIYLSLV